MYQALYRKWRPRIFDDIVGQEHVTDTLKNQVINGRLSHAYLFIGTRGTGKTSCAKILAKAVNCEQPENGNPCNKCRSCMGIDDGSILDVVEMDAASNNGVDNVRALRDEAVFSPASVKKRVYIIDEVHMLSTSAFNALLKILEEPPEHLMFILATTELHKIPATILSRCQRHSFKRIDPDSMERRISYVAAQENMKLESDAAALLARLADGSLRDGLSLLDQCSGYDVISAENVLTAMGLAGNLRIIELLNSITDGDTAKALTLFGSMWRDGKAPTTLLTELNILLRDILMIKVAPKGGRELLSGSFDPASLNSLAARMTPEELICGIDSIQGHIGSLKDGRDPKTTAELCIIGLCEPNLGDSIDSLKKRIAKLESVLLNADVQLSHRSEGKEENRTVYTEPNYPDEDIAPFDTEEKSIVRQSLSQDDINSTNIDNRLSEPESNVLPVHNTAHTADFNMQSAEDALDDKSDDDNEDSVPELGTVESIGNDDTDDTWESILNELKKSLLPGQFTIISNAQKTKGAFSGELFNISVSDGFAKGQLEQTPVMNSIRDAVKTVTGKTVLVKIEVNKENMAVNAGKLNDLSKFGNVKFE
ncbi:MAG: DNA polymerase III subunit gamma/tau [Clostridiales bacterium]|nr:DNA polymerase III subunit gamma/tau [Clostridiales bacterium]